MIAEKLTKTKTKIILILKYHCIELTESTCNNLKIIVLALLNYVCRKLSGRVSQLVSTANTSTKFTKRGARTVEVLISGKS